jgi:hypothetical protein
MALAAEVDSCVREGAEGCTVNHSTRLRGARPQWYNRPMPAEGRLSASRAAVMVVGVNLIAVWMAAAAGGRVAPPQGQADARLSQDRAVGEAQVALVEAKDRLRRHTGAPVVGALVHRDPFSFGDARTSRPDPAAAFRASAAEAGPIPMPAVPDIVLQGVAESREGEGIVRTAILSVDGELVFATAGATIGGRFTVLAVTADSVDLEALQGGARQTIHLR